MVKVYIYIIVSVLLLFTTLNALRLNWINAPLKIKLYNNIFFIGLCTRYISIIIFSLATNVGYLYLLKSFYDFNFIGVPALMLSFSYVFLRKDGIKYIYIMIMGGLMSLVYILGIYKFTANIYISGDFGYIIRFLQYPFMYFIYLIILGFFFIISFIYLGDKKVNKKGILLMFLSCAFIIGETLMLLVGSSLLPETLFSELLCLITFTFGSMKFKRSFRV